MNEPQINKSLVYLQGRSLGGAVALYTADKYPKLFRGLIIENTFTSISDMVDEIFPFVTYFKDIILRIGWRSIDIVPNLEMPILYITGDQDKLVPPSMTKMLFN